MYIQCFVVNRHIRTHHRAELRLSTFHQDLRGSQSPWQHYSFNSIQEKVPICRWDSSDIRPVMQKVFSCHTNWNGNVIILITFSSLATPKVVRMTIFGVAISDSAWRHHVLPKPDDDCRACVRQGSDGAPEEFPVGFTVVRSVFHICHVLCRDGFHTRLLTCVECRVEMKVIEDENSTWNSQKDINTLRPEQHGWPFADNLKCIFLSENVCILV